jgi:hypothetical protein
MSGVSFPITFKISSHSLSTELVGRARGQDGTGYSYIIRRDALKAYLSLDK